MDKEQILKEAKTLEKEVVSFRRHIHKNPELSFQEEQTALYIENILDLENIRHKRVAITGVLAIVEGTGDLNQAVVLRADTDALPISEQNNSEFNSRNEGVMHACGHDMHTAALLGALIVLNRFRQEFKGTVLGLFQPGEELCPGGASMVLKEDPFKSYKIKAFIGEHVDPELPTGIFGFRPGKYMASSDEVRITVEGEGGHAAMPQKLKDPVVASAAIITALQQIVSRNDNPGMPTVLSIGKVIANGATNIIPDTVYMEGTFRTFDEKWREEAKKRIHEIAEATALAYGVKAIVNISDGYPCVVNSPLLTEKAKACIQELYGKDSSIDLDLRPTAEDFGYYTQIYPSIFYRVGVGGSETAKNSARLHTPKFNPDEKALEYAVSGLVALTHELLSM